MRTIRVHPGLGVWIVDMCGDRKVFVIGSEAERYAKQHARERAASGGGVRLQIFDLSHQLIAELSYGPAQVLS
jgi:hypothetical protein